MLGHGQVMTMIEKVARAIEKAELGNNWEAQARAAIEAMREPTEEMAQRGGAHLGLSPRDRFSMKAAWKKMIDAALNEKA